MRSISTFLLVLGFSFIASYYYPHIFISPGDVSSYHKKIEKDCFKCHTGFSGIKNENCTTCHLLKTPGIKESQKPFKAQPGSYVIASVATIHEHLGQTACYGCHPEHAASLLMAPKKFDHAFGKEYETIKTNCQDCHIKTTGKIHQNINHSCTDCHNVKNWKPSVMDHSRFFIFSQEHPSKCTNCHEDGNYKKYSCYGCHEHSERSIRSRHVRMGIYQMENCVKCHKSSNDDDAKEIWRGMKGKKSDSETHSTERSRYRNNGEDGEREHEHGEHKHHKSEHDNDEGDDD